MPLGASSVCVNKDATKDPNIFKFRGKSRLLFTCSWAAHRTWTEKHTHTHRQKFGWTAVRMLTSYVCRVLLYGSSSIVVESRKKVMSMRLVPFFFPPIPSEKPIVFYAPFAFSAWTTLTTLFPNEPRLHRFAFFFWAKTLITRVAVRNAKTGRFASLFSRLAICNEKWRWEPVERGSNWLRDNQRGIYNCTAPFCCFSLWRHQRRNQEYQKGIETWQL